MDLYVLFVLSLVTIWVVNEKTEKILLVIALILTFFSPLYPAKYAFPGISLSFSCYQVFLCAGCLLRKDKDKSLYIRETKVGFSCRLYYLRIVRNIHENN